MSKKKLKSNIISDNKLSLKLYYHPDSWNTLTNENKSEIHSRKNNKNSISSFNSVSFQRFSLRSSQDDSLPPLNITDRNKTDQIINLSAKDHKSSKSETEPSAVYKMTDDTVNEVLDSLQNLKTTDIGALTEEFSGDFSKLNNKSIRKSISKQKVKKIEKNDSPHHLNDGLINRLNYLSFINPNPDTKFPKLKALNQQFSISNFDDNNNKMFHSKIMRQKTKQKSKLLSNGANFFAELDVNGFLREFLENTRYLTMIKNKNTRAVASIFKGFLEYTKELGSILLTADEKDLKKNLSIEGIKENISQNKNMVMSSNNFDSYDMEILMKLYYFNLCLQRYLEKINHENCSYQNQKYNEEFENLQRVKDEYLTDLKQRNMMKYQNSKNILKNNEIGNNPYSLDILKCLENTENSIGRFSVISAKTRLACKYADELVSGRLKKPFN